MFDVGFAYLDLERTAIPHLWVVVAEPDSDERVIVSVTSDKPHIVDRSCPLRPGDHEFIDHLSYALFDRSTIVTVGDLSAWTKRGNLVTKESMAPAVIDRIRIAALSSDHTPGRVKRAVRECWWAPPRDDD